MKILFFLELVHVVIVKGGAMDVEERDATLEMVEVVVEERDATLEMVEVWDETEESLLAVYEKGERVKPEHQAAVVDAADLARIYLEENEMGVWVP